VPELLVLDQTELLVLDQTVLVSEQAVSEQAAAVLERTVLMEASDHQPLANSGQTQLLLGIPLLRHKAEFFLP